MCTKNHVYHALKSVYRGREEDRDIVGITIFEGIFERQMIMMKTGLILSTLDVE